MNHIQIYDNALSKNACNNIIKYYDDSPYKTKGVTGDGVNEKSKKGMQLSIFLDNCPDNTAYSFLEKDIIPSLNEGIKKYRKTFPFLDEIFHWNISSGMNIQKFEENEGYFARHSNRILVWMIYLNNAKCGTRFYYPNCTKRRDVKAKQGRLVIWPADWTYPHSGITPNRGEKYFMTGWYTFK
mgnify:FL=1